jgi:hypothetical protein
MPDLKIVENATCPFCGCVCDDLILTVEDNKITQAKNACVLGKAWFHNHRIEDRPVAWSMASPRPWTRRSNAPPGFWPTPGGGRFHHGDLRHQHSGHGLPHGRRADAAAAGVRVAVSE